MPDLSSVKSREDLTSLMASRYPEKTQSQIRNWISQVWAFARTIAIGDQVAMPSKLNPNVEFGTITSGYAYHTEFPADARHVRRVKWEQSVPRSAIPQDIRFTLGAFLTVCRVERNNAEERLRQILASPSDNLELPSAHTAEPTIDTEPDIEELARDAMRDHIGRNFVGHDLAKLVETVLVAQGYHTRLSPPGPDGGIDILAGLGNHGFEQPRLAVQVKSGLTAVDTSVFREFQGVMRHFGADYGLIVSWGGFRPTVQREVPREFFRIRLWNDREFIDELTNVYDELPAPVRAKLPLKQIWVLAENLDE